MQEYFTVSKVGTGEFTEKKSKFIATVVPVHSQEEAMSVIEKIRTKYWDAKHNVYAYILLEGQQKRYSDDSEPSGTAGVPVLNILEKAGLKDTLVVVTRYFGGILLGTGGLVRAYSQAAKLGVENAGIVKRSLCDAVNISMDYTLWGKVQKFLEEQKIPIKDISYTDSVTAKVLQIAEKTDVLIEALTELSDGKISCQKNGQMYADFDINFN